MELWLVLGVSKILSHFWLTTGITGKHNGSKEQQQQQKWRNFGAEMVISLQ